MRLMQSVIYFQDTCHQSGADGFLVDTCYQSGADNLRTLAISQGLMSFCNIGEDTCYELRADTLLCINVFFVCFDDGGVNKQVVICSSLSLDIHSYKYRLAC